MKASVIWPLAKQWFRPVSTVLIILKAAVPLWKNASRFGQEADAKKPELAGCFAQDICPRHLPEYPRLGFCLAPRIKNRQARSWD
jgi:hypothetical protein